MNRSIWLGAAAACCLALFAEAPAPLSAQRYDYLESSDTAPTPLESLAHSRGSRETWSAEVGTIEGPAARVTVTAIAVAGAGERPLQLRGLRLGLEHRQIPQSCDLKYISWSRLCAQPDAAVYLDEPLIARALSQFRTVGAYRVALFTSTRSSGQGTYSTGIMIGGYALEGRSMNDLIDVVERGAALLANAPQ
jgi:hypothetical protein